MTQPPSASVPHRDLANAIRALSMDAVERANSGHPGMPMGMADVATVLFTRFLKFDPAAPDWPDRDRFVLSAGHGSMLLYSLLYLTGYPEMTLEQLKNFRQLGSITAGHPEYGHAPGIETTTGPLGQGLANAVGMALAERLLNARFGDELVDHHTYVIAGDGCLMEGISHEAIDLAGHLKLSKLIVLFDDNSISIDGPTSLATSMNQLARFEAAGWDVHRVDGHNEEEIYSAITVARRADRPSLIACRTIIGYGAPNKQGTAATHGSPLGAEEIRQTRAGLGWDHEAFEIPGAGAGGLARLLGLWQIRASGLAAADAERCPPRRSGAAIVRPARQQAHRGGGAGQSQIRRRRAETGDAAILAGRARGADGGRAGSDRRFGGPDRLERHENESGQVRHTGGLLRQLHPLRRARARHGRRDERHRPAWRVHSLQRHLPDLLRLLAPGDPPRRPDGPARRSRHDA